MPAIKHILIDANVAAAHYAPKSTRSVNLKDRARNLFAGRPRGYEVSFIIPNFCIAEVFAVFEKYRWGGAWNPHVNPNTRLTPREFQSARRAFHRDIHNGRLILQHELNRYHILCVDLISPINAAYKIKRSRGNRRQITPAKTYDILFVAMGIWLQKLMGQENFVMVTGDERIALITKRAQAPGLSAQMKEHLTQTAKQVGLQYSSAIYPEVVDLVHSTNAELKNIFPDWNPAG